MLHLFVCQGNPHLYQTADGKLSFVGAMGHEFEPNALWITRGGCFFYTTAFRFQDKQRIKIWIAISCKESQITVV